MRNTVRYAAAALLMLLLTCVIPAETPAAAPAWIHVSKAPAPLFDDPVWHGAADPFVVWMPNKGANHTGQWWMYYTQRRAAMRHPPGVLWCHGTAIGIATSADGIHWKYRGICRGPHGLGDPMKAHVTWWAPCFAWQKGTLEMFVVEVHGIFTSWTGRATIEHFASKDGVHWTFISTVPLSSSRCIDPTLWKIHGKWYMWYKDERHGSRIWMAESTHLNHWRDDRQVVAWPSQEAPFVWRWHHAYWLITDTDSHGLRIYRSKSGTGHWVYNATVLAGANGRRTLDNAPGHHPAVITQKRQCVLFYFTQFGRRSYIQMAHLVINKQGKARCLRNEYAPR